MMIATTMLRDPILFLLRRGLWVSLSETEAGKQCVSPPSAAAAVKNLLHHQRGLQDVFIFKDFLLDPPSRPLYDFADFPSPVSFYLAFRPSPFQAIILNDCDAVVQYTVSRKRNHHAFSPLFLFPPAVASHICVPLHSSEIRQLFAVRLNKCSCKGPLNFVRNATKIRGPVGQNSFHRIPRLFCSSLPPPVPSRWYTVRFGINKAPAFPALLSLSPFSSREISAVVPEATTAEAWLFRRPKTKIPSFLPPPPLQPRFL